MSYILFKFFIISSLLSYASTSLAYWSATNPIKLCVTVPMPKNPLFSTILPTSASTTVLAYASQFQAEPHSRNYCHTVLSLSKKILTLTALWELNLFIFRNNLALLWWWHYLSLLWLSFFIILLPKNLLLLPIILFLIRRIRLKHFLLFMSHLLL